MAGGQNGGGSPSQAWLEIAIPQVVERVIVANRMNLIAAFFVSDSSSSTCRKAIWGTSHCRRIPPIINKILALFGFSGFGTGKSAKTGKYDHSRLALNKIKKRFDFSCLCTGLGEHLKTLAGFWRSIIQWLSEKPPGDCRTTGGKIPQLPSSYARS